MLFDYTISQVSDVANGSLFWSFLRGFPCILFLRYAYLVFIELDEKRDGYKKRCGYCRDLSKCNYESSTCLDKRWPDMKQNDNKQGNVLHILSKIRLNNSLVIG